MTITHKCDMKIKYSSKFILEKRKDKSGSLIVKNVPIYLDFTFNGQRLRYFTGYRINVTQWDFDIERVKKNNFNRNRISSSIINQKLSEIQSKIEDIYIKSEPYELTVRILRERLKEELDETQLKRKIDLWQRWIQFANEYETSKGYKKHLLSTKNHLETFCVKKNIQLTFKNCTQEIIEEFIKYLKEEHSLNTVAGIMKRVNTFFNYAVKNNWIKVSPLKEIQKVNQKYGDPIYLSKQELDQIYKAKVTSEKHQRTKDLFLFQCFVGCRVSDLMRLTKDNIVDINGIQYIEYIPVKTKKENQRALRIPLTKKAQKILRKYNFIDGKLLPAISSQKYNKNIRELLKDIEFERTVIRLNPKTRLEETVPLQQIASSHLARRTFIGILHKSGHKNEVISSMSGHTENSRAFSRYYSVDDDYRLKAIKSIE